MKNILILLGYRDSPALDLAKKYKLAGDCVTIIQCDQTLGLCMRNPCGSKAHCSLCKKMMNEAINQLDNFHVIRMKDLVDLKIYRIADAVQFEYHDNKSLKDLVFHNVEVGYGAFSTYVSLSRHCNPAYNDSVKSYLNALLREQVLLTLAIENHLENNHYDLIILHNGRFAQFKPLLNIAKVKGIDYITTEIICKNDLVERENNFFNNIPHSVESFTMQINRDWESHDEEHRNAVGKLFFENRRNAIYAGDKIYAKDQILGELPKDWDDTKENIVFCNSSEDEYLSISKEFDDGRLFKTQFEAFKIIFEHYKNDESKHFYIRIHPNLKDVDDVSHLALYKLNYDNVTIISPESTISTYTLIDKCNKTIVFDSTAGAEAVYWGKPVIALDRCQYADLDIVYTPHNLDDLFRLMDNSNLPCKYNINVIKYGFFLMREGYKTHDYVPVTWKITKIFGKEFRHSSAFKIFGSSMLFEILAYLCNKLKLYTQFKKVPMDRDLWGLDI